MLTSLRIAAAAGVEITGALMRLPGAGKPGRKRVKKAVNDVFARFEDAGVVGRLPAFDESYEAYSDLRLFEDSYAGIRHDCEQILKVREQITDMAKLGGDYTSGGIHTISWKAFMIKSGTFVEPNCSMVPNTTAVLRRLPMVHNAFFSILEPRQYISPHWGYYKGFVRYHLGVIIPNDNADRKCWLRVNADRNDNRVREKPLVERGEKYYWRNGKGVVFDDTNLHDAANGSDEIRVVLWLDVERKLPPGLTLYNRALLSAAYREPSIRRFRENSIIKTTSA